MQEGQFDLQGKDEGRVCLCDRLVDEAEACSSAASLLDLRPSPSRSRTTGRRAAALERAGVKRREGIGRQVVCPRCEAHASKILEKNLFEACVRVRARLRSQPGHKKQGQRFVKGCGKGSLTRNKGLAEEGIRLRLLQSCDYTAVGSASLGAGASASPSRGGLASRAQL